MSPHTFSFHFVFFLFFSLKFPAAAHEDFEKMIELEGGVFRMGTDDKGGRDGENPSRKVKVKRFWIDKFSVTNEEFKVFVRETKYKTEAENFGWSFVLDMFVSPEVKKTVKDKLQGAEWWLPVNGAYWRQPFGPKSSIKDKGDYPVVHISWNDAVAYCKWKGKRLPLEREWEFAARGGLTNKRYPWGDEYNPEKNGKYRMNIWQGKFPKENSASDGFEHTAPVESFGPQNDYGVYNMVGNVWEWVMDKYKDPQEPTARGEIKRVLRGGSYLDSLDGTFNHRTRVTTRMGNTPDSGSDNLGFRCAKGDAVWEKNTKDDL